MGSELAPTSIRGDVDLRTALLDLTRYGCPRLRHDGKGWSCSVEMHVAEVGTEFNVRSDFHQATPELAVMQVTERIAATVAKYR